MLFQSPFRWFLNQEMKVIAKSQMRTVLFICLYFASTSSARLVHLLSSRSVLPRHLDPRATCSAECAAILDANTRCASRPSDTWCGCDVLSSANATTCLDCLVRTQTTLPVAGLSLDADAAAVVLATSLSLCRCQSVTQCGQYVDGLQPCGTTQSGQSCVCPVTNQYLPACASCMKSNGANATLIDTALTNCHSYPTPSTPTRSSGFRTICTSLTWMVVSLITGGVALL